jgi:hypothetical protein
VEAAHATDQVRWCRQLERERERERERGFSGSLGLTRVGSGAATLWMTRWVGAWASWVPAHISRAAQVHSGSFGVNILELAAAHPRLGRYAFGKLMRVGEEIAN